jgi:hypothetical protein
MISQNNLYLGEVLKEKNKTSAFIKKQKEG